MTGPGGKQILLEDPSGNVVELFQPAARVANEGQSPNSLFTPSGVSVSM